MTLGKKILELRRKSKRTQQQVSELTGLAVSYLSRLENDRISPSIRTLTKISEALHVPLTSFFDHKPILEAKDRCPVSLSGQCILDQLFIGQGRRPETNLESYSPQQLEILRACNFLLHTGDKETVTMLSLLMKSLTKTGRITRKLR
jgi:transcriptional regulator with XRE-family HTH domain